MVISLFQPIRVAIRGGGDLGSGVAYRLHRVGFPVLITELPHPLLVRRAVSFGSAVLENSVIIEDTTAQRVETVEDAFTAQKNGLIVVIVDPEGQSLSAYNPAVLIDARMLKTDPGKYPVNAPLRIGLGPGFSAPDNCDAVIETNRGHFLGRVIRSGAPEPNTGVPGRITGQTAKRVLRAPATGVIKGLERIGAQLKRDQPVAEINGSIVTAPFDGVLRGLVHDGARIEAGTKIGDVDPRGEPSHCFTISDKALAIGGGVLEAILSAPAIREQYLQT